MCRLEHTFGFKTPQVVDRILTTQFRLPLDDRCRVLFAVNKDDLRDPVIPENSPIVDRKEPEADMAQPDVDRRDWFDPDDFIPALDTAYDPDSINTLAQIFNERMQLPVLLTYEQEEEWGEKFEGILATKPEQDRPIYKALVKSVIDTAQERKLRST